MTFSAFVPPHEAGETLPVMLFLSGLTCAYVNVTDKGEYRRACAAHRIIFVAPDTSPRGVQVPDTTADDFGQGAGFYVDATQEPWKKHFKMYDYIARELPEVLKAALPEADLSRLSISGHSMGGHGALTIALKNPGRYRAVSAFAPICAPSSAPWGFKAFTGYLGTDAMAWRPYDAVALIEDGARLTDLLVDQGEADPFISEQLRPVMLRDACAAAGIKLTLRYHHDYDHGYSFISTFMADHVEWHAERLKM